MDNLRTARALALRNAMLDARNDLNETHERYQLAFEAAMATDADDQLDTLQQEGRAYAYALTQYIASGMDWLGYADRQLGRRRRAARRKAGSSDSGR